MGERKRTNKYHAPDFTPLKLPRRVKNERQIPIPMMVPMKICYDNCGNYISEGSKVNSHKEDYVNGEMYLGIKIFKFYFKRTNFSSEIVIKTDPRNSDYVVKSGMRRRFESVMSLEEEDKRSLDCEREREILAALEEMKSMNSRRANVSVDAMLEVLKEKEKKSVEDEEIIKSIVFRNSKDYVRRFDDHEDLDDDDINVKRQKVSEDLPASNPTDYLTSTRFPARVSVIKKQVTASQSQINMSNSGSVLKSSCQNYSNSDDGEDEG